MATKMIEPPEDEMTDYLRNLAEELPETLPDGWELLIVAVGPPIAKDGEEVIAGNVYPHDVRISHTGAGGLRMVDIIDKCLPAVRSSMADLDFNRKMFSKIGD